MIPPRCPTSRPAQICWSGATPAATCRPMSLFRSSECSGAGMPDPAAQLLAAADDATLLDAVAAVGGFHRALHTLFDYGLECQRAGDLDGIAKVIDTCDRIEVLARCAGPQAVPGPASRG